MIEKMKERESLFNEYVNELKKTNKLRNEEHKQAERTKTEKVMKMQCFVHASSDGCGYGRGLFTNSGCG